MQINSTLAFFLGLAATASAHMRLREPEAWFSNNSPLDASGSDFPCKAVSYDDSVPRAVINKGESSPLRFLGSAVHGGGSCQISLTTDLKPTANSVWKVIKSIEGGCPARNITGNYPENAGLITPDEYDFVIPEGVPAGKYTLAWTWFNKVGNREMYMNCAPAEAVGSGGDEAYFDSLPDMFTANIGNGCSTPTSKDIFFPDAGEFVERFGLHTMAPVAPSCGGGSDSGSGGGVLPPLPTPTLPGGVFREQPDDSSPPPPAKTQPPQDEPGQDAPPVDKPGQDAPPVDKPADIEPPVEVPANNGTNGGSGFAQGTPCTSEGQWNCIAGTSFQRCASGIWSAVQQVAAGTSCVAGVSDVIQLSKRGSLRFGAKFIA